MTKAEAKRRACFRSALVLQNALDCGWEIEETLDDEKKIFTGLRELIEELHRRSERGAVPRGE